MLPSFLSVDLIPHKPGIYIYRNSSGKIIYVGKAVDLYSRVSSYFNNTWKDAKTAHLVREIATVETIIVESEIEALILEANLIKKHKPLYNIRLTDDKDYLYIAITDEEFPKVITARKTQLLKIKKWFGPYPSATTVKQTLKKLRRIFPWCSNPKGSKTNKSGRACFYLHIGQCPGACIGVVSKEEYNKNIKRFSKFLDGKKQELLDELMKEMADDAKELKFEDAQRLKKIVEGINYITAPNKITNYLVNPNFLEDLNKNSLEELQHVLGLPEFPERIECYDISNFAGTEATGSMVVLTNGDIDKSQYRKFKIKITGKPNDFAMHAEMMERRLKHPEWGIPQLIIIDGGRGQVSSVKEVIDKTVIPAKAFGSEAQARRAGIQNDKNRIPDQLPKGGRVVRDDKIKNWSDVPVFGLAKREEWLYPPEGDPIKLPKKSLALRLLQKLRDESHRFAITYHRKLRKKVAGY